MIELTLRSGQEVTVNHKHIIYMYSVTDDEGNFLYTELQMVPGKVKVQEKIEEILQKMSELG